MAEFLLKLLDNSSDENVKLFTEFKIKFFNQYSSDKKVITKKELKEPLKEIAKELYGVPLDKKTFKKYIKILIKIIKDT